MTATAARAVALVEDERDEVGEARLGLSLHDVTVLLVIAAAQVAWLSALGYAAFRLL